MKELIFGLFGGTALLLLGIEMLGEGMERAAGEAMKRILNRLTSSVWRGVALGTVVTSIIQSSSATTVMLVGFVNAGMMSLRQALGVIYGANIGTTITAQLLRLKITDYAMPIIAIGMLLRLFGRRERTRNLGYAAMGFGILFHGLVTLSSGSAFLVKNPQIAEIMQSYASNLFVAILIGAVFTGLIQSSSASTGLVIALASIGLLDLRMSAGIVFGCNIGTCVTAMLASLRSSTAARRTAIAHLGFNVIGVLLVIPFFSPFISLIEGTTPDIIGQIANIHTLFNTAAALIFIPFTRRYADLLYRLVPGEEEEIDLGARHLDKLLLNTPDIALEAAFRELQRTAEIARRMHQRVHQAMLRNERGLLKSVVTDEEQINLLQREITRYMVDLAQHDLSENQSSRIPDILHIIGDLERIGDHAFNVVEHVEKKIDSEIEFSEEATLQLATIMDHIGEMNELIGASLQDRRLHNSETSRSLLQRIRNECEEGRQGHILRLEHGTCTVEAGIYFLDILSHYERIAEHYLNICEACEQRRVYR